MRTGWLKGEFSLRHYRRTGAGLVLLGVLINLPAVMAQWHLHWDYRWCAFLLQVPRELSAPFQTNRLCGADLWFLAAALSSVDQSAPLPALAAWR